MKYAKSSYLVAGLIGLAASAVSASPITMIHDGSGSGTIDGVSFTSVFTITTTGNTDDRVNFGSGWFIDHTSASINIAGVGTFDFITPTRTFVNNNIPLVGFSRAGISGSDLFNGPGNAEFASWDMTTSIGPLSGGGNLIQWGSEDVMTSGGVLFFADGFTDAQFTAIVPAPASLALIGLAGITATRRRRA
jgi:hypothetical protein